MMKTNRVCDSETLHVLSINFKDMFNVGCMIFVVLHFIHIKNDFGSIRIILYTYTHKISGFYIYEHQ